jgi:hypothetical protein
MKKLGVFLALMIAMLGVSVARAQEKTHAAMALPPQTPASLTPSPSPDNGAPACGNSGSTCCNTGPCCGNCGHPSFCSHLWAWLTYRPLHYPGICGCCPRCAPCCTPPLYMYFLCDPHQLASSACHSNTCANVAEAASGAATTPTPGNGKPSGAGAANRTVAPLSDK